MYVNNISDLGPFGPRSKDDDDEITPTIKLDLFGLTISTKADSKSFEE